MMKNPPVVRVEWVDTRMYPGWQDGQQAYEPVTVVNVGFLLNDDDHSKQTYNVAAQWSPEFGAGADVTVIPMGCVTDIDDLRDPANDPFFAVEDDDPPPLDCGNPNCEYPGDLCDPPPQAQPESERIWASITPDMQEAYRDMVDKLREKVDLDIADPVITFDTPEFDNPIPRDYAGTGRVLAFPARNPVDCPQWCRICRGDRFVENLLSSSVYFCSNSWCCGNEDEREKHARDRFLQYLDNPERYKYLAKYDTFGKES